MTNDTEGAKAIEAACKAYAEHPYMPGEYGSMQAAIRAYLAALPGWRLVRAGDYIMLDGKRETPAPGLHSEDSER